MTTRDALRRFGQALRRRILHTAVLAEPIVAAKEGRQRRPIYLFDCSECGGPVLGGLDAPKCQGCGLIF